MKHGVPRGYSRISPDNGGQRRASRLLARRLFFLYVDMKGAKMCEEDAIEKGMQADADSASLEELEAAADKLAEVEAQAEAEDLLSTEEREEHDRAVLEDIVARQGIDGAISVLRDICRLKAGRKDGAAACTFRAMARKLDDLIGWYYNCKEGKQPK